MQIAESCHLNYRLISLREMKLSLVPSPAGRNCTTMTLSLRPRNSNVTLSSFIAVALGCRPESRGATDTEYRVDLTAAPAAAAAIEGSFRNYPFKTLSKHPQRAFTLCHFTRFYPRGFAVVHTSAPLLREGQRQFQYVDLIPPAAGLNWLIGRAPT